jgi:hypothetical protein
MIYGRVYFIVAGFQINTMNLLEPTDLSAEVRLATVELTLSDPANES